MLTNTNYDSSSYNYKNAGFNSFRDMAEGLKNDYYNMIQILKKYGGFYVGMYELSNSGIKKGQSVLTKKTWYQLYSICKKLGSDSTSSRMIWGCQWDQMCKFINTCGDKVSLTDSKAYGNYMDSTHPYQNSENTFLIDIFDTGKSDYWKANNLYDIAVNCKEWIQEVYCKLYHISRGGGFMDSGERNNVESRENSATSLDWQFTDITSRPILYIK